MAEQTNIFSMLNAEDKLDGTNYPMWAYMMRHVLVAKQLWDIVIGSDERPASSSSPNSPSRSGTTDADNASSSTQLPTSSQLKWDGKDAQAHALIALSVKRHIVPHIRSCTTSKSAWDVLKNLYAQRNEARVAMLKRQLEETRMQEGESMDAFLTKIKDFKEQLLNIDEVISDKQLVSKVLAALPDSYQGFATTIRLLTRGKESFSFDELISLLLQEFQSRANRDVLNSGDQAFVTSSKFKGQQGRKQSNLSSKGNDASTFHDEKKKIRCNYCRKPGHDISECRKRKASEEKKKQSGLNVTTSTGTKVEAHIAQHEWAFSIHTIYDPSKDDVCLSVSDSTDDWYFDSGASKHITSCKNFFVTLEDACHKAGTVTCANNASYTIKGIGQVHITAVNGDVVTLNNVLYVPGIKKNLLSVSAIAMHGYPVHFLYDKCTVHDRTKGDIIVITGSLFNNLYKLDIYQKFDDQNALAVDAQTQSNSELWHARFGHLNFSSLARLSKHDMVCNLPSIHVPSNHVCEGCILGKMHRFSFPKDANVLATHKLQLVHSDVCGPMRTPSIGGYLYFLTFIDDATRHTWVYPLKEKSNVFSCFKEFLHLAENLSGHKLITLRTDRGGEYMSHEFNAFLKDRGIIHQCTTPYTPQQNGLAERKNRSLMEMARCMLNGKKLPHKFWLEAVMCANYVLNRCPTKAITTITPYEAWTGHKPNVGHMRIFGSLAYAFVPPQQRHKLQDKATKCIFVGYSKESKGYRLFQPTTCKIIIN